MRYNAVIFTIGKLLLYFIVIADCNMGKPTILPEYPDIKYCSTSTEAASGDQRSTYEILRKELDHNCTHVYGDIVLTNISKKANGQDPNLSFLSSIREVVGCVKVLNTNVSRIPLTQLQVIRGHDVHKKNIHEPHKVRALDILSINKTKYALIMDLRNLTSIHSGSVFISQAYSASLSYINWSFLITRGSLQKVKIDPSTSPTFQCSRLCPVFQNKRHCWGPLPDQCQKVTQCQKRECQGRCFISKTGAEECCHTQCLGGCTSIASSACFACKGVLNSTKCIEKCPYKKVIDRQNDQTINNKYFKFKFRNTCVRKCPNNTVEENGECKLHCENKNTERKGNKCVKCKKYCEKACAESDFFSPQETQNERTALNAKKLKKFTNCTLYKGHLTFNIESFHLTKYPIMSYQDLLPLQRLQVLYGALYIDFSHAKFPINNLSFLGNLEKIYKFKHQIPHDFAVLHTKLHYLGLKKLRFAYSDARVTIWDNPNLCYFDTESFRERLGIKKAINTINPTSTTCVEENKVCDNLCEPKYGCWGPGPGLCRICRYSSIDDMCTRSCLSVPGYYEKKLDSNITDNQINEKKCSKCDKQCLKTCNGSSSRDCIGGCKKYTEGDNCVSKCSNTHYLSSNSSNCLPCSPVCHKRGETQQPVCTGPSDIAGSGGCNKCSAIIIKKNKAYCTRLKVAPKGFYRQNQEFNSDIKFSQYFENLPDIYVTFRPCYKLCLRCSTAGPERTKKSGCQECQGFWLDNTCVETCPENITYFIDAKAKNSKGHCGRCHRECNGCTGPTDMDCKTCWNYKMFLNQSETGFTCLRQCSIKYKEEMKDGVKLCIYVRLGTMEVSLIIMLIVSMFALTILIMIVVKIRHDSNARRRGNKLKAYFSNANEDDSPHYESTEIKYLPLIQSDNITYKKEDQIGRGAFGAVYRGFWEPASNYFDDNTSLNSCKNHKTEVAIKILNDYKQDEFMEEVKVMASVRHKHCLRLIGVCYHENQALLITTYLSMGSMDKYLANHKTTLTPTILLLWAEQIANGMLYLSTNHIIHRDLATRNVLINHLDLVQITDFGLAKMTTDDSIRVYSGIVPVRWLAIEALQNGIYSHQTDVWAFGVTVWEIFSFAKTPYEDIKASEICQEIGKGTRLRQPDICSLEIYIILLKCWSVNPVDRPTFDYLLKEFRKFHNKPQQYLSHPNNEDRDSQRNNSRQYLRVSNNDLHRNGSIQNTNEVELMLRNCEFKPNFIYQPASSLDFSTSTFSAPSSPSIIYKNIIPANLSTEYLEPNNSLNQSYRNTER